MYFSLQQPVQEKLLEINTSCVWQNENGKKKGNPKWHWSLDTHTKKIKKEYKVKKYNSESTMQEFLFSFSTETIMALWKLTQFWAM